MQADIYQCDRRITRSILRASLVASVEIEEEPEDATSLAEQYDGDFITIDTSKPEKR